MAGHNRTRSAKLAGLKSIPAIVKNVDDDTAVLIVVNSNLVHREFLLPSEKGFAYKMQRDAMKNQGRRTDLKLVEDLFKFGTKLNTGEKLAKEHNESRQNIYRYIRLTELISPLLERMDASVIAFNAGVDLSYIKNPSKPSFMNIFL